MKFYNGDEERDNQCRELERQFSRRFQGLLLVWDEVNRNSLREFQKFTLKEVATGQKLRLIFVTNDSFDNDEMGSFMSKFEDGVQDYARKTTESLQFRAGAFSIKMS